MFGGKKTEYFYKKKITRTILFRKKIGRRHMDGCGKAGTENGGIMCQTNVQKQKKRHCNEFVEDDCRKIFKEFWRTGNKGMQDTFRR